MHAAIGFEVYRELAAKVVNNIDNKGRFNDTFEWDDAIFNYRALMVGQLNLNQDPITVSFLFYDLRTYAGRVEIENNFDIDRLSTYILDYKPMSHECDNE